MAFYRQNSQAIWYDQTGEGPDLILVHGNAASSRWWALALPALAKSFRVTRIDLPGFGQSDPPAGGYSLPVIAQDLAMTAQYLKLQDVTWVGHSLGGSLLLQLGIDIPTAISRAVLIDPGPPDGMPVTEEMLQGTIAASTSHDAVRAALTAISPAADHGTFFEQLVDDAMQAPGWIPMVKALSTWNILSRIREFQAPTLILQGQDDILVPLTRIEAMAPRLVHAELHVIPGVGHCLPLEEPETMVEEIRRFAMR